MEEKIVKIDGIEYNVSSQKSNKLKELLKDYKKPV